MEKPVEQVNEVNKSENSAAKRTTRAVIFVVLIVLIAKVLGLAKQIVQASIFGTTLETDIINLSQEFIVNIDYVISQMIITAFTSIYIHLLKKDDRSSDKFIINTTKLFLLISTVITVLVVGLAPFISKLLAPTYEVDASNQLTTYLRFYSILLIFFVLIGVFGSILNSHEKFVHREITTIFQNVIVILCIVLLHKVIGTVAIVVSMFAYVAFNVVYLGITTHKYWTKSFTFIKDNPFKDENIKALGKMLLPLLIGYGMIYINQQVDKILVSGMEEGTVTSLAYAAILSNLITTILASVTTIFYSKITSLVASEQKEEAANATNKYCIYLLTAMIPISIVTFFCSFDVVKAVFGHGKFDDNAVYVTSQALMGYAFIFIPYVIKNIYAKFLYANKTTKWPMINGTIGIAINIGLSILLSRYLGVFGVALATTIAEGISAILNVISSKLFFRPMRLWYLLKCLPFWALGGGATFLVCYFGNQIAADWNVYLRFFTVAVAALAAYAVFTLPMILLMRKGKMRI